ncbi:MAG: DUF2309 domain-containing protein [Candidatus Obscuribacterales bacterium]|nr:DUF2309 domain-containing protein [Candidatus Obscuribacterales bacterium]
MLTSTTSLSLSQKIEQAASCLNDLWPLHTFIALNALKGFENMPFGKAMQISEKLYKAKSSLPLSTYRAMYESGRINPVDLEEAFEEIPKNGRQSAAPNIKRSGGTVFTLLELIDFARKSNLCSSLNRQMIKWTAAYLDETQAQWKMEKGNSFYKSWRELAIYDLSLSLHGSRQWKKNLKELPSDSFLALQKLLDTIGVEEEAQLDYLQKHLLQLPGWASHLKWRESQGAFDILGDYLAIRLFYEISLAETYCRALAENGQSPLKQLQGLKPAEAESRGYDYAEIWQEAYEINFRNDLIEKLQATPLRQEPSTPSAQLVFCIDVRSERLRRNLEELGPYSTFGFAGFFGFAMQFKEFGSAHTLNLCPVLLKPSKLVCETSRSKNANSLLSFRTLGALALQLKKALKCSPAGAFGLAESLGIWTSIPLVGKTFFPEAFQNSKKKLSRKLSPASELKLDTSSFSLEEKINLAEANLKAIGLSKNFAELVLLCGHRGESQNNPYAAALDCGACGGNSGSYNAKLAVTILNDPQVRKGLIEKGIEISNKTIFLAAEHNTSTDEVKVFEEETLSLTKQKCLRQVKDDLHKAAVKTQAERQASLPRAAVEKLNEAGERASDWAQVAPEWGLAGNAAFIAAPRALTANVKLNGRAFLHSYDYAADNDGSILELIMTAPLVVAQWINMQYYLSSVDNEVFGSGSKTIHNVVGDFGVMSGSRSDLRLGLPAQSIFREDGTLEHEPMRLLALIQAPIPSIQRVLEKHESLAKLVSNRWLRLVALDPETGAFHQAENTETWKKMDLKKTSKKETELLEKMMTISIS